MEQDSIKDFILVLFNNKDENEFELEIYLIKEINKPKEFELMREYIKEKYTPLLFISVNKKSFNYWCYNFKGIENLYDHFKYSQVRVVKDYISSFEEKQLFTLISDYLKHVFSHLSIETENSTIKIMFNGN